MPSLDKLTKRAVLVTVPVLAALQVAVSGDESLTLRIAALAAFAAGWIASRRTKALAAWMLLAPLAPALVFRALGTQGMIADVVWMSGLSASLVRTTSWNEWALPRTWRVLLGGWGLTLSLVWPVLIARESSLDIRTLGDFTTANSWAMMSAPQVVIWTAYAIQTQLLGLLWLDFVCRDFRARREHFPTVVHAMWIGVTAASVVAVVQGTVDISFLNTPFWIAERRATGTLLDANGYAVAAAVAGPIGFFALRKSGVSAIWALAVLALNWSGVWMSGSRTGLMCALIGGAGMAVGFVQRPKMTLRTVSATAGIVAVIGLAVLLARADGPLARLKGPEARSQLAQLWARGGYGTVAVQMTREHPLAGVGAGGYRYLAPDYFRVLANMQLPPDNAQNWWRHQLAELGISGSLLVLVWSGLVAWHVLARGRSANRTQAWTARGLLAGIGLCSLFGMPTQNPIVLLWFFFLVAWLTTLSPVPDREAVLPLKWDRVAPLVVVVLAVVHVGGQILLARGPLSVAERARRFSRDYVAGGYGPERREDGHEFHWTDNRSEFILPAHTRWIAVSIWAHHPDITERPVRVTLSSPCRTVFQYELRSPEPVYVGVTLPPGMNTFDAVVRASRTWRPADYGQKDTRRLGVAVLTDFVNDPQAIEPTHKVAWGQCPR